MSKGLFGFGILNIEKNDLRNKVKKTYELIYKHETRDINTYEERQMRDLISEVSRQLSQKLPSLDYKESNTVSKRLSDFSYHIDALPVKELTLKYDQLISQVHWCVKMSSNSDIILGENFNKFLEDPLGYGTKRDKIIKR